MAKFALCARCRQEARADDLIRSDGPYKLSACSWCATTMDRECLTLIEIPQEESMPSQRPRHSAVARELREDSRVQDGYRGRDGRRERGARPDPAIYAAELRRREQVLAGEFLDQLDRAHPSYAVTLPDRYAPLPWHPEWVRARREYVEGDDSALGRMREYVTMANPPLHSDVQLVPGMARKVQRPAFVTWQRALIAVLVAAALWVSVGLGWLLASVLWALVLRCP